MTSEIDVNAVFGKPSDKAAINPPSESVVYTAPVNVFVGDGRSEIVVDHTADAVAVLTNVVVRPSRTVVTATAGEMSRLVDNIANPPSEDVPNAAAITTAVSDIYAAVYSPSRVNVSSGIPQTLQRCLLHPRMWRRRL